MASGQLTFRRDPPCVWRFRREALDRFGLGRLGQMVVEAGFVAAPLVLQAAGGGTPTQLDRLSRVRLRIASAVDDRLEAPTGHDVNVSVGSYTYVEPGAQGISIHVYDQHS